MAASDAVNTRRPARTRRPLIALLAADAISLTGSYFTLLAIPWFVLTTTGSAARSGLTAAIEALAVVVAGATSGPLVDRLGHVRASVLSDLGSALAVAAIPLMAETIGIDFWQLIVLVFAGTLLGTPGIGARRSLYAVAAEAGAVHLTRTNTAAATMNRAAGLVGPLLAGILIAATGAANVLWIDAASFLASALIVTIGVGRALPRPADESAEAMSYLKEMLSGLHFVRGDRVLAALLTGSALGSLLAEPIYTVVFPVYARETTGKATSLGVIFAGLAAGSLTGNALSFVFAHRLPRRTTIITGFAVRALAFWILVPVPSILVVAIVIGMAAIALEPVNPITTTVFQERVPETMRGRVFGPYIALSYALRAMGVATYGVLLQWIGLHHTLLLLAAVNFIVPLFFVLNPGLRDIEQTRD